MTPSETLDLLKTAMGAPNEALAKAITQSTGLVAYDLQGPALSMVPFQTPLRNTIPRVGGGIGTATNWKAVTGINTGKLSAGVSEGNRGAVIDQTVADYTAAFRGLGFENSVSFEADRAGQGFQDVKALAVKQLLTATMIAEEQILWGGNTSNALGVTPTPTVATATSGGAIASSTAVSVICVALTHGGYRRSTVAAGIPQTVTKTNADASTDTFGGGAATKSAAASVTTGGSGSAHVVTATVAPVFGAVAYAWYVGVSGSEKIAAITTINSAVFTALPGSGQAASALTGGDCSTNSLVFDGLLTFASKAGSGSYRASLATGTAGTGNGFTSDGAGGIAELTTAFTWFFDNYRLSPDVVRCSAQELINMTKIVIANGGVPLVHYQLNTGSTNPDINAGARLNAILNPITQQWVRLEMHPDATPGTVLLECLDIPYPLSGVAVPRQVLTRQDYYQLEWPLRSRKYEYGVYCDEVLQHYAPFATGVITNIANR